MPSSYTKEAFVVHGNWSPETRKHPALRFLENAAKEYFDTDHSKKDDFHHEKSTLKSPHGDHHEYDDGIDQFYKGPLTAHVHEPYTMIAIESKEGYILYVQCHFFANVAGTPVAGEEKVKDSEGAEWDVMIPIFYEFDIHKDSGAKHELKIHHINIIKDTGAVNEILDKRGAKGGAKKGGKKGSK